MLPVASLWRSNLPSGCRTPRRPSTAPIQRLPLESSASVITPWWNSSGISESGSSSPASDTFVSESATSRSQKTDRVWTSENTRRNFPPEGTTTGENVSFA